MIPVPGKLLCPRCAGTQAAEEGANSPAETAALTAVRLYRKDLITEHDFSEAQTGFQKAALLRGNAPELNWYALLCKKGIRWLCTGENTYTPLLWKKRSGLLQNDSLWQEIINGCKGSIPAPLREDADRTELLLKAAGAGENNKKGLSVPDIFFCLKTEADDRQTPEKLYCDRLLEELKVQIAPSRIFYAPENLAGKKEREFEPAIFQALQTNGLMIIFASSVKNLMADSVRSEWLRAVSFGTKDICLCTLGKDMHNILPDGLKVNRLINAASGEGAGELKRILCDAVSKNRKAPEPAADELYRRGKKLLKTHPAEAVSLLRKAAAGGNRDARSVLDRL